MSDLIAKESPLRRLPSQLERRQRIVLDGIRLSVEMAELALGRLCGTLLDIDPKKTAGGLPGFAGPFIDAWSVIDAVNRLRSLVLMIPGTKDHPDVRGFLEATDTVRELRNDVQHLNARVDGLASQKLPAWGVISWVTLHDDTPVRARSHVLVAGSVATSSHYLENPVGQQIRSPIDLVKLNAHGRSIDLGRTLSSVAGLVELLERQLKEQFGDLPSSGSDLYAAIDVVPSDEEPDEPRGQETA